MKNTIVKDTLKALALKNLFKQAIYKNASAIIS